MLPTRIQTFVVAQYGVVKRVYRAASNDDVATYAAALAFHTMLALFPFFLFLLALVSFLGTPALFVRVLIWSRLVVPEPAMNQVTEVIQRFREGDETGLVSVGALAAIWAASGGIRSAMNALNRAYDVEDRRTFWHRYGLSVLYTIAFGAAVLISAALMFIGPRTASWLGQMLGLEGTLATIWTWIRYPILLALLLLMTATAFSVLPNGRPFKLITPGSFAAIAIWLLASLGFRFYVANFGRYNVLYGSVGAIIVLLLFLYLSAFALLIGGELNAVIEQKD